MSNGRNKFIANSNRFIDIQKLTREIVHAFISKMYVYEKKEKLSRTDGNVIAIVSAIGLRQQHTVRTSDAIPHNISKNRNTQANPCLCTYAADISTENATAMAVPFCSICEYCSFRMKMHIKAIDCNDIIIEINILLGTNDKTSNE